MLEITLLFAVQGMQKCAFCYTKSRPRVSKNTKKCIILMILFTKFRTGSLDHMRRGSNVVLPEKTNQKMTLLYVYLYKPAKLPRSLK